MKKFYITTPIYYINDIPHAGHAYTTVAADIFARFYRMILGQDNVYFLTGTDEHGAKVEAKAREKNMEPQDFADQTSAAFRLAWDRLNISNDDFIRTTETRHKDFVIASMLRLKEAVTPLGNSAIYDGIYEGLYCTGCESFKTENDLNEQGQCPDHLTKPELVKEKNWFFRLSDYGDKLKSLIDSGELQIRPEIRKNEILGLLETGLRDLAITRPSIRWGIPVPWDESQTIYVWVDALSNYVSALGGGKGELYDKFWPADCHLMSKDILKFHAVIWPSLLLAQGFPTPKLVFAHGFFTNNGQKMSKTIGNVIDPNQLVDKYGADAARYLLVSQFGFGTDGDISLERFDEIYNAHLAGGLGNLVSRVTAMVEKYFQGISPAPMAEDIFDTKKIWADYQAHLKEFKIEEGTKSVWSLISAANKYIDDQQPWALAKTDPKKLAEVLYNLLEVIRHISVMLWPVMPDKSDAILVHLGLDPLHEKAESIEDLMAWGRLKEGAIIIKGDGLFPRLEHTKD